MKFIPLALVLILVLAVSGALLIKRKKLDTHKAESTFVKFNLKDLPEHGISLIAPSDPSFANGKTVTTDPYSILLKNTSNRTVVGYSIKWECFDGERESADRDVSHDARFSNILGVVFLYGEESDRRAILNKLEDEVIKPHSTWLISENAPARQIPEVAKEVSTEFDNAAHAEIRTACPVMTVTADGVFFDDGTFIGPDTTNFFAKVKTQMDARYEVLQGVQNELKSGKKPSEVFKGLEQIREREGHSGGEMTINQLRSYFRNMFAQDVLGKKEVWGPDKAIEEVQQLLSRPWVKLRKL